MRFAPKAWGEGYSEISLKHFRDVNVHGFTHYLDHPAVTGALFRSLVPHRLSQAEIDLVANNYPVVDPKHAGKRAQIEQVIAGISHELRQAYDDEANVLGDSIELLAGVARRAWKSRKLLGQLA
jgi:hypothetical protein